MDHGISKSHTDLPSLLLGDQSFPKTGDIPRFTKVDISKLSKLPPRLWWSGGPPDTLYTVLFVDAGEVYYRQEVAHCAITSC